jgi:cytochrome c oxidase cbb3-type subunit 4
MTQYDTLRHFADSWVLLAFTAIILFVFGFVFRPGSKNLYDHTARIPLDDDKKA